jgi:uncharacterized membrane protein YedE/YeeE
MTLDWSHFTPVPAVLGGMLIGLSAAIFILVHGRILGASGVFDGLFPPMRHDWVWRVLVLAGLIMAPVLLSVMDVLPQVTIKTSPGLVLVSGVLVGFGTTLGSGCTSGHGVCGIARLSPRSIVATGLFLGSAIITATLAKFIGWVA